MVNSLIYLFGNICEVLISAYFFSGSHKLKVRKKTFYLFCVLFTLMLFLNTTLFLGKSYMIILGSFLVVLGISFFYQISTLQRVAYSVFLYIIHALAELFIGMAVSIIGDVDVSATQDDMTLFMLCTLLSKFSAYIFALILRKKRLGFSFRIFSQNFLIVFSMPIASILMIILLLRCLYQINDNPFMVLTLITSVALVIGNISVFYVMDKQNELIDTKKKLVFTQEHINNQAHHYTELYKYQKELREFRHDEKNRLVALMAMIEAGQSEKALQTMENCLSLINETNQNIVNSGNPIIDAILQAKLNLAKKENVELRLFVRFESEINIDEIDFAIILGNALDNAIEAVNKLDNDGEKYIDFRLIATYGRISVAIKNPVKENLDVTRLSTTKEDSPNHGLGISSIKSFASKYDGIVDFSCEDKIFTVSINLSNLKVQ